MYIYNGMLLSHKNNKIIPCAATGMDLETVILSELSWTEKDKSYVISFVEAKENKVQMNLFTKQI